MSPTQRSLKYLRERYPLVQVVERWIPQARKRIDLYGFGDILCVGEDVLVVQTTSGSNLASRVSKITDSPALPILRKAGVRVEAHGWRKLKGGWAVKVVDLS